MDTIELALETVARFPEGIASLKGLDPKKTYQLCNGCELLFEEDVLSHSDGKAFCEPCFEAHLLAELPKLPNVSDQDLLAVVDEMSRLAGDEPIPARDRCRDEALGRLGDLARRSRG
jgi:hypothetical protein